jgi:hypothetical protein
VVNTRLMEANIGKESPGLVTRAAVASRTSMAAESEGYVGV